MREYELQAPHKAANEQGPQAHEGTIIPETPNMMGRARTPGLRGHPRRPARHPFRGPGAHLPGPSGPLRAMDQGIAEGLTLRHDNGPQYVSDRFQQELVFLGIEPSP